MQLNTIFWIYPVFLTLGFNLLYHRFMGDLAGMSRDTLSSFNDWLDIETATYFHRYQHWNIRMNALKRSWMIARNGCALLLP